MKKTRLQRHLINVSRVTIIQIPAPDSGLEDVDEILLNITGDDDLSAFKRVHNFTEEVSRPYNDTSSETRPKIVSRQRAPDSSSSEDRQRKLQQQWSSKSDC